MNLLCSGRNMDGARCTRHRSPGEPTCWWHKPTNIEARARKLEEQAAALRSTAVAPA